MKMNLQKNKTIQPLLGEKKGWNLAVEILLFIVVFFVCSLGQGIVILPAEIVALFTNEAYLAAVEAGDMVAVAEASVAAVSNEGFMTISLIAEIVMIAITLGFCVLFEKRNPRKVGFTKGNFAKEYGMGLVAGFAFFSVAVLIAMLTGSMKLSYQGGGAILILFAIGFMIQGMAEEVLCRGYLMCSVARRYPLWVGVVTNAVVFAALHLLNAGISVLAFVNLVLFGIFASLYFIRRGNIWGIGAFHSVWNFVQGNFYGIQVSGNSKMTSVLSSTFDESKELINGGAFGLEGGIAVTIVMVVGIVLLYLEPWKKTLKLSETGSVMETEAEQVMEPEAELEAELETEEMPEADQEEDE